MRRIESMGAGQLLACKVLVSTATALAALLSPVAALALTQPNGTEIPTQAGCDGGQPTGLAATFACVCTQPNICNIGDPCPSQSSCDDGQNGNCETTLWHSFNDNTCIPSNLSGLDPYAEAAVTPETFRPTCPQTFSMLSRGTAMFQDAFGWYNVTGSKPTPADLHVMLDCTAQAGDTAVLDLQNEPGYLGGDVGFFIITPESTSSPGSCAGGDCCATVARFAAGQGQAFFSERDYNPDFIGNDSLIHLLTYQSHLSTDTFYFAWEDIFGGSNNDFTDIVTGVSGIHCSGGGQPCDTGLQGACARGVTMCKQGVLVCDQVFASETETCNGVDDDCDGSIDIGAVCPQPDHICHQGSCVPPCSGGEFPCIGNTVCDSDSKLCVHPDCVAKSCEADKICRAGNCVAPCEGIICPHGQQCVADKCINLCAAVTCDSGFTCVAGKCLPGCGQCNGITCELPLECNTTESQCLDPSCPNGCPDGTFCKSGECIDNCDGAVCPGGEQCVNGQCGGGEGGGGTGGTGSLPNPGGAGGAGANAADDGGHSTYNAPGCSCRLGERRPLRHGVWLLALAAALAARRRRS